MRFLLALSLLVLIGCDRRKCLESHPETRHSSSWMQYIPPQDMGNGFTMPAQYIFHPDYDYVVDVCDRYEEESK